MSTGSRVPVFLERAALVVLSPLLFLLVAEGLTRLSGVETDLARNDNARIAVPVWLLADDTWVSDRRSKMRRSEGEPIDASEVAWLYHFEEARWIQYRLKPNVDVQAVNPFNPIEVERKVTFHIISNDDGFRTREFLPKRPGTVRIVTLGDSSTFGWGVDPEQTYQSMLAERLAGWVPGRFEILNLGIPGHNTRHGIGILEHYAAALDPDLLIIAYGSNDPRYVPVATDELLAADDTMLGAARFAMLRLRSYRLLRKLIFTLADPLDPAPTPEERAGRQPVRAVPLESFRDNLERLIDRGSELGAHAILMSVCTAATEYADMTRTVASERNVPFVDVGRLFADSVEALRDGSLYPDRVAHYRELYRDAMKDRLSYFVTSDGCHPHWVGHSLIADRLFETVRATVGGPAISAKSPGDPP